MPVSVKEVVKDKLAYLKTWNSNLFKTSFYEQLQANNVFREMQANIIIIIYHASKHTSIYCLKCVYK